MWAKNASVLGSLALLCMGTAPTAGVPVAPCGGAGVVGVEGMVGGVGVGVAEGAHEAGSEAGNEAVDERGRDPLVRCVRCLRSCPLLLRIRGVRCAICLRFQALRAVRAG